MIVVSDTTPLNYLILIEQAETLPLLYGRIIIPQAVFAELQHERAPVAVKEWLAHRPAWLEVQQVSAPFAAELERLDEGEREAIILAERLRAVALIMDERDGVRAARRRALRVIGTLGVLAEAAARGLLNLPEALERLQQTSFRVAPTLLLSLLEHDAELSSQLTQAEACGPEPEAQDELE